MRSVNNANGAERNCEVGMVWKELQAPGGGNLTLELPPTATIRVSAGAITAISIEGVTSITLRANEVERLNVGPGMRNNNKRTVTVVITSVDVAVQIAEATSEGLYRP